MITSRDNEKLKLVRKLATRREREKTGLFVCEGEDLVDAARAAGVEPVELLVAGENVEPRLLAEVSSLGHPPRVLGIFQQAALQRGATNDFGLALWRVADPGNVGTLIRTADAFGAGFVALSDGCADPTGPKAVRASMGALFRVPLISFDAAPRPWVALVSRGAERLEGVDGATFVLGAEREGLPPEVADRCDLRATIPLTAHAESLNVAAAGAIALYERSRRRATNY